MRWLMSKWGDEVGFTDVAVVLSVALLVLGIVLAVWGRRSGSRGDWIFSVGIELAGTCVVFLLVERLSKRLQETIARRDELTLPTKFRVTDIEDGKGLLLGREFKEGEWDGEAWRFVASKRGHVIYGPYLRRPLPEGTYVAAFRLKIADPKTGDRPIVKLDVVCAVPKPAHKTLGKTDVTASQFRAADKYEEIPVGFPVSGYEC